MLYEIRCSQHCDFTSGWEGEFASIEDAEEEIWRQRSNIGEVRDKVTLEVVSSLIKLVKEMTQKRDGLLIRRGFMRRPVFLERERNWNP